MTTFHLAARHLMAHHLTTIPLTITWCQVYDWDRFSKNDLLGEVVVPLGSNLRDSGVKWAAIQPPHKK